MMKSLNSQSYKALLSLILKSVETRFGVIPTGFNVHDPDDIVTYLRPIDVSKVLTCKEIHRIRDEYHPEATIALLYSPSNVVYLHYNGKWNDITCEMEWEDPTKVQQVEIKTVKWEVVAW